VTSLIEERRFRRHHRSDPAPGCDSSSDADGTPRALTRWGQTTKDNVALCRLAAWAGSARSAACADPTSSPRTRVVTGHPSAVTGPSCCRLRSPPRPASWELCTRGTAGGGRPAVLVSVGNGREAMSDQVDVSVQFRSTGPRDALKPARYGAHGRSPSGPRDVGYYPSTVDSHIASSVTTRPAVQVHRCRYMRWEARSGRRDAGRRWWSRLLVVRVLWVRVPRAHYYPGSARCPKACRGRLAWAVGAPVGGI